MRVALPKLLYILALAAVGPGLFASAAAAEDPDSSTIKVRADGFAEGDGRTAQSEALAAAELAAVEVAILDIVGEAWLNRLDAVYAQSALYIRTSRPLDTVSTDGGVNVRAEVYVYESQLRRDIAAVLFRVLPVKPRVAVLMGEQIDGLRAWSVGDGAAQRFFESRFKDAGFAVVDIASRYAAENLSAYQAGTSQQLAGFGRDVGADVVVRGDVTAVTHVNPGTVNVGRVTAKMEVEVIRPSDAAVVDQFTSEATVNSPNSAMGGAQAIDDASTKIVQEVLVSSVIAFATAPPPTDFVLRVNLPGDGPWLTRARKGIGERFPQAQIQDLHHSPREARFRVTVDVSLSDLVHGLTDTPFEEYQFATQRAVGRELEVDLVPLR